MQKSLIVKYFLGFHKGDKCAQIFSRKTFLQEMSGVTHEKSQTQTHAT